MWHIKILLLTWFKDAIQPMSQEEVDSDLDAASAPAEVCILFINVKSLNIDGACYPGPPHPP